MSNGLEQKLVEVIDQIVAAVKTGAAQLPALAEQALRFWFWEELLSGLFLLALACVCAGVARTFYVRAKNYVRPSDRYYGDAEHLWAGMWVGLGLTLGLSAIALGQFFDAIKVVVAPQLYLVESLLQLAGK